MAASLQMTLENGGVATVIANYLNPLNRNPRDFENLKILGTEGVVETTDDGREARIVSAKGIRPINKSPGSQNYSPLYFDYVSAHLVTGAEMPLTLEEELHPLRMLLRARKGMAR